MSSPALPRNTSPLRGWSLFGIVIAALAVLMSSVGCVQALGDFETRGGDASFTESPDGGAGDGAFGEGGPPGPCASGAKECKAQDLMVCNGTGMLQSEATCPYLCTSGACTGICKPGEMKCEGNMVSTCTDKGAWNANALCSTVCGEKGCTGVCAPGGMQCDKTSLQSCNAEGKWQDTAACAYVCQDNACSGICEPGTRQCKGNQPQICSPKGAWANDGTACPFVCSMGACAGSCTNGATQCSTRLRKLARTACSRMERLARTFAKTARAPAPAHRELSSAWPTFCRSCDANGAWTNAPCPFLCSANTCTGVCTPGLTRCNGKTQQVCNQQAQWADSTACPFFVHEQPMLGRLQPRLEGVQRSHAANVRCNRCLDQRHQLPLRLHGW